MPKTAHRQWCNDVFGCDRQENGTRRDILLVKTFVEPDGMCGGGMERGGLSNGQMPFLAVDQVYKMNNIPCCTLPLEIIKTFYGKKDAIYSE